VCSNSIEEDLFEDYLGPVEPKSPVTWEPSKLKAPSLLVAPKAARGSCSLDASEIPASWLIKFPTGAEIVHKTLELRPRGTMSPDDRLLRRRICEYEIFQSVENAFFTPRVRRGFSSIDEFIVIAQRILQSRKSRSGNSLELHTREILLEEGFKSEAEFSYRPTIEGNKRPDFIFPSAAAYEDRGFPENRLRMLAAKTTCKDRWRQVINEADRIGTKHLLTLQEGVSENQFREMTDAGIALVVPAELHHAYPASVKPRLMSLESFMTDVRMCQA
jgi:hypothetical protein